MWTVLLFIQLILLAKPNYQKFKTVTKKQKQMITENIPKLQVSQKLLKRQAQVTHLEQARPNIPLLLPRKLLYELENSDPK